MNLDELPLIDDELDLLDSLVPLAAARLVEAVCGAARLSRELLRRHAGAEVTALEVDDRQHAKNLADPADRHFAVPVQFRDFAEFEQRMMRPTFADHGIDAAMVERVRALYAPHQRSDGARFRMPMHVRLLRRL